MHAMCAQSCLGLCSEKIPCSEIPWTVAHQAHLSMGFPKQGYWVGCHFLLQGIFLTQESNPGLLHCKQILYHLSHQGSYFIYLLIFLYRDHFILYQCILSGIWDSEMFQGMLDTRFLESALSNNSFIHRVLTLKVTACQIHQGNKLESTGGNKRACKK